MNNRERNILYEKVKTDPEAIRVCFTDAIGRGTNFIKNKYGCRMDIARSIVHKVRAEMEYESE